MRISSSVLCISAILIGVGCNQAKQASAGPRTGTLKMDNLTPEQQIEKVQNDPQIPEGYKQTFINSIRAKQGQPPIAPTKGQAPGP